MSARPDSWMPIYWGDYSRDTGHLNAAGHGAYLMLIKHYWCGGAPLADDDDELWRIACCDSKKEWLKLRSRILRFFTISDGFLRHKRIDHELEKASTLGAARAERAQKGAQKRWKNHPSSTPEATYEKCLDDASSMQEALLKQCPLQPQPHSSVGSDEPTAAPPVPAAQIPATSAMGAGKEPEPEPPDPRRDVYNLGRAILGKSAGGMITKLVDIHDGDLTAVLYTLRQAENAAFPREYLGKILSRESNAPTDWNNHPVYRGLL